MTRIKICGITQLTDAAAAIEAGADALGFVFADSPRRITPGAARDIIRQIPPFVQTVGVFVVDPASAEERGRIERTADTCGFGVIQLHCGYSADLTRALRDRRLVLGARVRDRASLESIPGIEDACGLLLDTHVDGVAGGTGRTFDWSLAVEAKKLGKPVIMSGGLTPENVARAIETAHPYAVDVSSGVESSPGRKDPERVREFIERARSTDTR